MSRTSATAGQDRPSPWWNASGPLEAYPTRVPAEAAQRWRDLFEERAAIREHDGGLSRAKAEAGALADLAQQWRSENPLPASDLTACCHCGKPDPCMPVLACNGHAWLHAKCWAPMNEKRQREAEFAIRSMLGRIAKDSIC